MVGRDMYALLMMLANARELACRLHAVHERLHTGCTHSMRLACTPRKLNISCMGVTGDYNVACQTATCSCVPACMQLPESRRMFTHVSRRLHPRCTKCAWAIHGGDHSNHPHMARRLSLTEKPEACLVAVLWKTLRLARCALDTSKLTVFKNYSSLCCLNVAVFLITSGSFDPRSLYSKCYGSVWAWNCLGHSVRKYWWSLCP